MILPPHDALAAAFALGACFGAALVLAVVLAVLGVRALRPAMREDRSARRAAQRLPVWHPEHPDNDDAHRRWRP